MEPRTYEEAYEVATLWVYDKATFHAGQNDIVNENDRVAWLKSLHDLVANGTPPHDAIVVLLEKEQKNDIRDHLLETWIEYVKNYEYLRSSQNNDKPAASDDATEPIRVPIREKKEGPTPLQKIREKGINRFGVRNDTTDKKEAA